MSAREPKPRELQASLFAEDELSLARREWRSMPEFHMEDATPWKSVTIHFASRADMEEFSRITGVRLTKDTKSSWFSSSEESAKQRTRYADEDDA